MARTGKLGANDLNPSPAIHLPISHVPMYLNTSRIAY